MEKFVNKNFDNLETKCYFHVRTAELIGISNLTYNRVKDVK